MPFNLKSQIANRKSQCGGMALELVIACGILSVVMSLGLEVYVRFYRRAATTRDELVALQSASEALRGLRRDVMSARDARVEANGARLRLTTDDGELVFEFQRARQALVRRAQQREAVVAEQIVSASFAREAGSSLVRVRVTPRARRAASRAARHAATVETMIMMRNASSAAS